MRRVSTTEIKRARDAYDTARCKALQAARCRGEAEVAENDALHALSIAHRNLLELHRRQAVQAHIANNPPGLPPMPRPKKGERK